MSHINSPLSELHSPTSLLSRSLSSFLRVLPTRRLVSSIGIARRRRAMEASRYADADRRARYGHRLRFAIIVDGVIDAHLSRRVADNRRAT